MQRISLPQLRDDEALVRVSCCTLCGSDLSTLAGHRTEPVPCVLGHEIIGTIEATGPRPPSDLRGRLVSVGDRVVWSVAASCDDCRNCKRRMPQKCMHLKKYGHHRLTDDWKLSGGLAEYCHLVAGTKLLVIDNAESDERMCPASCATATVAAAMRVAGEFTGARVLVLGAGMLGLTASAAAKQFADCHVTICDVSPERLANAKAFGADSILLWNKLAAGEDEKRFDIILEMSGNPDAVQATLELAATGAHIVLVGSVRPSPMLTLDPEQVVRRLLTIHGTHNYLPEDLVTAVDFLCGAGKKYPFESLVSQSTALVDLNATVAELLKPSSAFLPIRIAVRP